MTDREIRDRSYAITSVLLVVITQLAWFAGLAACVGTLIGWLEPSVTDLIAVVGIGLFGAHSATHRALSEQTDGAAETKEVDG